MIIGSRSVFNLPMNVREHNNSLCHDDDLFVSGSIEVYPSWGWLVVTCYLGFVTYVTLLHICLVVGEVPD